MNFYNKFVNLCNSIGKKPSAVAEEIGLSKSLVTRWKRGGGITDATAAKVADYFGVELIDLVGEDESYNPNLDEEDEDLLEFEEELQIMRDDPATRSLLKSGKGLTQEQIDAVNLIIKQMRRTWNVDDS